MRPCGAPLGALLDPSLEEKGIPARWLAGLIEAHDFVEEFKALQGSSTEHLQTELAVRELPFAVLTSRLELAACLGAALLSERLTQAASATSDCFGNTVSTATDGEHSLKQALLDNLWLAIAEARSVPHRLATEASLALVGKALRLELTEASRVESEYRRALRRLGLPPEQDAGKAYCAACILNLLVWEELGLKSVLELKLQVTSKRIATEGLEVQDLVKLLFVAEMCAQRWASRGVDVHKLGVRAAIRVVSLHQLLEQQDLEQIRQSYAEIGLPPEAGVVPQEREQLLERCRCFETWRALPLHELQRECQEEGLEGGGLSIEMPDDEKRTTLVDRLVMSRWADAWATSSLPIQNLAISSVVRVTAEAARLKSMTLAELREEFSMSVGLPTAAFKPLEDAGALVQRLVQSAVWKELSLGHLREDCLKLSISWCFEDETSFDSEVNDQHIVSGLAGKHRRELYERLVMASWADSWEESGIPVRRLSRIKAATYLQERWEQLNTMRRKELEAEYDQLGLPPDSPAPRVLELLPRLKQVFLWQALPLAELQKECRRLTVTPSVVATSSEALRALVLEAWGPPKSLDEPPSGKHCGEDKAGGASGDSPPSEVLRKIAVHFQTLDLPATASVDDLKRAYRRLCLRHHPDKNPDLAPEESAAQFRRIVEAYDALCEFMKLTV